jgi:hypothetical protein
LSASAEQSAIDRWTSLAAHLNHWFHEPDLEALRVGLAATVAHFCPDDDPVWLMVIGPPSTGKTAILIEALSIMPHTWPISDLTSKTLLSGKAKDESSGKSMSLLHRIGPSGILLFKDFTTFLSKRPDERTEVAAQLREIYDGHMNRHTGSSGDPISWKGKVTCIAAATPDAERVWASLRGLGERFITIRWPRGNSRAQAHKAALHLGRHKQINETLHELAKDFLDFPTLKAATPMDPSASPEIINLAEIAAVLRTHVHRERDGKTISGLPEPEGLGRLMSSLVQLARAHASLFRRLAPSPADIAIPRRVALDTIPPQRRAVYCALPDNDSGLTTVELSELTHIPRSSVYRVIEDLEALQVGSIWNSGEEASISLTPHHREVKRLAGLFA